MKTLSLRTQPTRRRALEALATTAAAAFVAPSVLRGRYTVFAQSATTYSARAIRLMEESTVVDLLNQFRFADYADKPPRSERFLREPGSFTAADWAVYKGTGMNALALGHGAPSYEEGVKFFAEWNGFLAAYPDWFTRIDDISDFARARATGKLGILLSFQDSLHFRSPTDVDTFHGLGQRISQLTYNFNNKIGSGFLEQRDGGLSVFGLSIMERMQNVGMAVDVSHCGDQTTLDALDAAKKTVIFTHATARALIPGHLRCKTDEAIRKMAKTGGVMGIAYIRFMDRGEEPVTIEHVLDHFDYVAKLVGVEHVGVGSDLDVVGNPNPIGGGMNPRSQPNFSRYQYHEDTDGAITVKGLNHPKRMFDLTEGLIRRGYKDADISGILGGNAIRALEKAWTKNS
ncbi:MAG: membrane dipeptidase [Vicinamibacteria bacterium]